MGKLTLQELESHLWKSADILRGSVDSSDYKSYFIAAESEYQEGKNQNTLRDHDLQKIVAAFDAYENIEKYAHVVSLEEIKGNDYNLNITRYVDKSGEEEQIHLTAVLQDITELVTNQANIKAKLNGNLKELGIGDA